MVIIGIPGLMHRCIYQVAKLFMEMGAMRHLLFVMLSALFIYLAVICSPCSRVYSLLFS